MLLKDTPVRGLVAKLSLSTLVAWGVLYYAFTVFLPAMQDDLGISPAKLSVGFSVGILTSGLLSPAVGGAIDRSGARTVMSAGALAGATGLFLWSVAETAPLYLLAWVLIGSGMAATLYQPAFATLVRADPSSSRLSVLYVSLIGALASTVFLPVSTALIDWWTWRPALRALAIVLFLTSLPLNLTLPSAPNSPSPRPERASASPRRALPALIAALMLADAVGVAFTVYVVSFLIAGGQSPHAAAFAAGSIGIAKIIGRLATRLGVQRSAVTLLRVTLVAQAAAFVPVLLSPSTVTVLGLAWMFGASSGARTVLRPAAIVEVVGARGFGRRNGVVHLFATGAKALAPVAGGFVLAETSVAVACGVLAGLLGVSALILPRPRPHEASSS